VVDTHTPVSVTGVAVAVSVGFSETAKAVLFQAAPCQSDQTAGEASAVAAKRVAAKATDFILRESCW